MSDTYFKTVLQAVLLFGSYTWVANPRVGQIMRILHRRVAHHLTGKKIWRKTNGVWYYTYKGEAMWEAGL